MSLVPVLDVEAPPPAPPAPPAPRGRLRSLFLVLVALVVTCSLGFIPAASAAPVLLVPVAKGVTAIGASVLTEKAFDAMWNGTGDKPADDDNSDSAKKGRGKWGQRLKGLRDVASGLLGSLFGLSEVLDDGKDGIPMPKDFQDDVSTLGGEPLPPKAGQYANFTIRSIDWGIRETSGSATYDTFRIRATCAAGAGASSFCPSTEYGAQSMTDFNTIIKCHTPGVGYWDQVRTLQFNRTPITQVHTGLCRQGQAGPAFPEGQVHSFSIVPSTTGGVTRGVLNPGVFYNPDFRIDDDPDAGATVTAEVKCRDSAGVVQTLTKTVAGTDVMPLVSCPPGAVPESISWTGTNNGQSEWLGGVGTKTPDAYPDCPPGRCVRVITVDDVPCRVGVAECYDWQNVQPPSRVKCEYGPYDMPLAECADLKHIHKTEWGVTQDPRREPDRQPGWLPSLPDGTVDWTRVGTEPRPEDNPNPEYRPPVRGPLVGAPPQTGPTNPPTTAPSNPPFPTTGVNPPEVPPGVPPPRDPDAPTRTCIQQAWSFNPVDWVFIPVKCAFVWAFIPKDGVGTNLINRARDTFDGIGLGRWFGIFPSFLDAIPSGDSGCQGPALTVPASMGGQTYYPLNACSDPAAKYAQMSRSVMSVVVTFAGLVSIINSLSMAVTGYRAYEREGLASEAAANKRMEAEKSS